MNGILQASYRLQRSHVERVPYDYALPDASTLDLPICANMGHFNRVGVFIAPLSNFLGSGEVRRFHAEPRTSLEDSAGNSRSTNILSPIILTGSPVGKKGM